MAATPTATTPRALLFDVFGTVVDWRTSICEHLSQAASSALNGQRQDDDGEAAREARERAASMSRADWLRFADDWRARYYKFTRGLAAAAAAADTSGIPAEFKTIDQFFYESLHELVAQFGLRGLWSEQEVQHLSTAWRRLQPWADTVAGLHLLNQRVATCTLSNGSSQLLKDMAEFAHLPWTHVFSSEMFNTYKPDPRVYLGAAEKLALQPAQCAMVACHLGDLRAAKDNGLFVIFVERPLEESSSEIEKARNEGWVDIWVDDRQPHDGQGGFVEVAKRLGI